MSTDPPLPPDSNSLNVAPNLRALLNGRTALPETSDIEDYFKRLDPVLVLNVSKASIGLAMLKMSQSLPGQHVLLTNDLEDLDHFEELRDPKVVGFGDFGADMDYPNRLTELLLAELAVNGLTRKAVLRRGLYLSTRGVNLPKNARDSIKANPNSTEKHSEECWLPHYLKKVQPSLILATVPAIFKISTSLHHVETLTVASQIKDKELIKLVKQFPYARIGLLKNCLEQFVYGAESETQKEIDRLSEKDQKIYEEELNRLSSQHKFTSSYPSFDLRNPKEPILHGLQHLNEGYTHEQACRFLAMSKVHKFRTEIRKRLDKRLLVPPTVSTVTGHYALYRITEKTDGFYKAEALHRNVYEYGETEDLELQNLQICKNHSQIIGYQYSPATHIFPGNTVAVKSVRRNDKTGILEVLQFHIIDRNIFENRFFMRLPTKKAVVLGFGAPVDIKRDSITHGYIYRGNLFVTEAWSSKMCREHYGNVEDNDGIKRCTPMPSIIHQDEYDVDESSTQHFRNYTSNRYTYNEYLLELVTVLGSTVAHAQRHGRYDGRLFTSLISQEKKYIEFSLNRRLAIRWYVGTKVVLSLPGQTDRMAIVTSVEKIDTEVLKIRAKLRPGADEVDQKMMTVYQWDMDAYPCLELGYFQKLPEGSNGKRIIQALYGGPPMIEDHFGEPLELGDYLQYTPNRYQAQYLYRILGHAPITVGLFPFGSGKTLTVVWAAYLASIRNPRSQHVLVARNHLRSMDLVRKLSIISGDENYVRFVSDEVKQIERTEFDIDKVMVAKMIEMVEMSEQTSIRNYTLHNAAAAYLLHHNHIHREDLPEPFRNPAISRPEILESSYWIRKFFQLFPPTFVICTTEDVLNPDFGPLENVETVQFDETTPTTKIELVTVCQKWPNAKFGLIGDPWVHFSKPIGSLEQITCEPVPAGLFPELKSDIVYRGNPLLLEQVLGLRFQLEDLIESRIRIHEAWNFRRAVIDIAHELSPSTSLGVIFLIKPPIILPHIQQKFTMGSTHDFVGSSKDTVIISTREVTGKRDDWKKTGQLLYTALTTVRRETILVGIVAEMRKTKIWSGLVEFVERNN